MKKKLIPFALLFSYLLPLVGCAGSKTCTITFDPNNGEETFSITVNKGDLISEPESPEKTAYDFKYWKHNNVKWSFKYEKVESDMTLLAYYKPIEYSLTILPNGGYLCEYEDYYTIESEFEKIAEITKPGYVVDYYIDQDDNHITTLNGIYGDKVLTPHWSVDNEHFVLYGKCPSSLVRDENLIVSLDNLLPNPNYYGDISYQDNLYRRYNTGYKRPIDNVDVPNFSDIYLKYDPIAWVKLYETNDYNVYMSAYILDCYKQSLSSDLIKYSGSSIDTYVQALVPEFFSEEEINGLYDFQLEDSTAKLFLPSFEEMTNAMSTLVELPFISSNYYHNMSLGILSNRSILEEKCSWYMSAGGKYINYLAGNYATRTFFDKGLLRVIANDREMDNYKRDNLNIRPCIAIKK